MSDYDVAIIGYRPTGMTLAALLGQLGRRVLVLERYTGLYNLPRAACFDDEIMRTFQKLGLVAEISRGAEVQSGYEWVNAAGQTLVDFQYDKENQYADFNAPTAVNVTVAMKRPPAQRADVLIRFSRQVSGLAQLAFTRNALVRLGRMFDPVLKLAAGAWRSFRHHVRSARCIDRSTGSGMKFHVVTDRKLVGHCLDPDCRLVTATLGSRTIAATKPANLAAYSLFRPETAV